MTKEKQLRLQKYAADLQQRISSPVPAKHVRRAEAYIDMLRIDLKKTLANLARNV